MAKRRFLARFLDDETIKRINPRSWIQWRDTTQVYRQIGYDSKPPETGDLLVQSPSNQWYNLTWGLSPSSDMPKWRWMYRGRPEIRRGIDTKVILAVGRGFSVVCEEDAEVEQYTNRLLNKLNIRDILQSAVSDMLVYGQAYFEKVRVLPSEMQEYEKITTPQQPVVASVTRQWLKADLDDINNLEAWVKDSQTVDRWSAASKPLTASNGGDLIELKPIDPLWMRINRDSFNNITGFVQWGITPVPQSIPSSKIVFLRWFPKSWSYESAYGTSVLMPVARHISLLIQAEEDMKVYWHQYAKPMLIVKAGTQDKPYPQPRIQYLVEQFKKRQSNTDAVIPGDCEATILQAGTAQTTTTFIEWVNYLRQKIYETLGIPSILMNLPDQSVRATSDVSLQAFIAEERMIQDIVGEQFLKQVLEPEVKSKFERDVKLRIVWPPILEEDRNQKMDRLIKATGVPFVTVNESRSEMGLPPMDRDEHDKLAPAPMPGPFSQISKPEPDVSRPRQEEKIKRDRDVPSAD